MQRCPSWKVRFCVPLVQSCSTFDWCGLIRWDGSSAEDAQPEENELRAAG